MKKGELRDISNKLGILCGLIREPKYRKVKWLPDNSPIKAKDVLSQAQDIVNMFVELKSDEPEEGEFWLVELLSGHRTVGEVCCNCTVYLPGSEEDNIVRKFIRKIDMGE